MSVPIIVGTVIASAMVGGALNTLLWIRIDLLGFLQASGSRNLRVRRVKLDFLRGMHDTDPEIIHNACNCDDPQHVHLNSVVKYLRMRKWNEDLQKESDVVERIADELEAVAKGRETE
jgi:hypothetical protein